MAVLVIIEDKQIFLVFLESKVNIVWLLEEYYSGTFRGSFSAGL